MERQDEREGTGGMACPQCGGVVETVNHPDVYRFGDGESAVELDVVLPVRWCRACDFEYLDHEAERIKHEALCRHFGVLTPWQIRGIREGHRLNRAAFAKLTGLGAATLARWESGILIQTLGNDRYLRMIAARGGMDILKGVVRRARTAEVRLVGGSRQGPRFRCLQLDERLQREADAFSLHRMAA